MISNDRLRRAFIEKGSPTQEILGRVGWDSKESARLLRGLGLQSYGKRGYTNNRIGEETALLLAEALDLDPVDIGL